MGIYRAWFTMRGPSCVRDTKMVGELFIKATTFILWHKTNADKIN